MRWTDKRIDMKGTHTCASVWFCVASPMRGYGERHIPKFSKTVKNLDAMKKLTEI